MLENLFCILCFTALAENAIFYVILQQNILE